MLKKFSKFLLLTLLVFIVSFSSFTCLAHEEDDTDPDVVTSTETNDESVTTDNSATTEPEIHYGDLYLFDNDIVMDKLVDGNVFIFGNNVEITGQVNGNLFIFANNVYYNGACNDLYVAANKLEMSYNSYVARDVKAICSNVILKSVILRDVDLFCSTLDFGEGEDIPVIYGDLRYTANTEITIPEGVLLTGSATYTKPFELANPNSTVTDILIGFATCIVTVLAIYIILNKLTPKFIEKITSIEKFSVLKLLKAFGIGIATIIIVSIFFMLLIGTLVGINLAFILALLFAILCLIAVPTLVISITISLKPTLKLEKTPMFYLVIVLTSIILYGITLIPYVGSLLGFIINITSIGLIVSVYMPHKELTDEEKLAIEEAKKQVKENKERIKQEKLEAKKQKKLETAKKKENNN